MTKAEYIFTKYAGGDPNAAAKALQQGKKAIEDLENQKSTVNLNAFSNRLQENYPGSKKLPDGSVLDIHGRVQKAETTEDRNKRLTNRQNEIRAIHSGKKLKSNNAGATQ